MDLNTPSNSMKGWRRGEAISAAKLNAAAAAINRASIGTRPPSQKKQNAIPRPGAGVQGIEIADVVATTNITLSGAQTIDGMSVVAGWWVLVTGQTTPAQNGVYECKAGAWEKQDTMYVMFVLLGTENGKSTWYSPAENVWEKGGGGSGITKVNAATTANITLSGAQTIDGISCIAGYKVLVKNQSTASQNGVYTVATGAWIKVGQPDFVVAIGGTLSGKLSFLLTTTNTYAVLGAAYL
jgi:hypothetical protein